MSVSINDSILNSIKQFIGGIAPDYTVFDPDLLILINSEFSTLHQLGVGTEEAFQIMGPDETWEDFTSDKAYMNSVREYIGLRVKMMFDPPQNSFVLDAYKQKAEELAWRLNVACENDGSY